MKRLLAIAGSLRKHSYNRSLLRAAAELAPAGMSVVVYDALSSIPLFDEDLENATGGGPEPVRRLREQVETAEGILIATPEYNHSVPGVLKNAIDWLSRPAPREVLAGKPVALIGASGGPFGTRLAQAALRQVLYATESLVLPGPALYAREAAKLFDGEGRLADAATRDRLAGILSAFAVWIDRLRAEGAPGSP
jgi:chromate reductase, NAD(P)H dehydrogenase (quinone)